CAETQPRCDVGYICTKQTLPFGTREICVKTEALPLNARCTQSEECKGYADGQAVCADQHRTCPTGKESACNLQCRKVCNAAADPQGDECGPDEICWPGAGSISGVCQAGECGETARDKCPTGLDCFWYKSGPTGGFCYS